MRKRWAHFLKVIYCTLKTSSLYKDKEEPVLPGVYNHVVAVVAIGGENTSFTALCLLVALPTRRDTHLQMENRMFSKESRAKSSVNALALRSGFPHQS